MEHAVWQDAALTVAFALFGGILAQTMAAHLRMPGIVVLLATGVLLGPDALGLVHPEALGEGLQMLVGFAVAVVLFEGGLNLDLSRLRAAQRAIRQLLSAGALVTVLGGTLTTRLLLDWDWRTSILFGTLVIVTGPTVISPLLKRIRIERTTATVLEAEGVLIDAIGAIVAAVALEVAISPSAAGLGLGLMDAVGRLGFGALLGVGGGFLLAFALRFRNLIPEGTQNVFTLSLVWALFQGSNRVLDESGIAAVIAAGMVLGNSRVPAHRDLLEFKEQLTVMLIGLLFVLLAATVRMADVRELGWNALLAVGALMVIVRPLNVLVGTWGSGLNLRQKLFIAWMGPRGIVAAAVASFFAGRLEQHGLPGGAALRAMVFLVIAITVAAAGLSGGLVAGLLRLRRPRDAGWLILGANEVACAVAVGLEELGEEAVCIDTNPHRVRAAEARGIRVLHDNGLSERVLQRVEIETRSGAIGLTDNEEVNLLFLQRVRQEGKLRRLYSAVTSTADRVTPEMIRETGGTVLFGGPRDLEAWAHRLHVGRADPERWVLQRDAAPATATEGQPPAPPETLLLPLVVAQGGRVRPVGARPFLKDALVVWLVAADRAEQAHAWLTAQGWARQPA